MSGDLGALLRNQDGGGYRECDGVVNRGPREIVDVAGQVGAMFAHAVVELPGEDLGRGVHGETVTRIGFPGEWCGSQGRGEEP